MEDKLRKLVFIIVIIANWSFLFSQTSIPAGNVAGTWDISGSPYLIEGDIIIPINEELIIEPGVSIIFQGFYNLLVNGCLQAVGAIADSIFFTAADTTNFSNPDSIYTGWNGIVIDNYENLTPELTKISYCDISYSKRLIDEEFEDRGGAILVMWQSFIEISYNKIHHNMARIGGAICSMESNIFNNLICNNYATSSGGGLFLFSSNVLANNIIVNNLAINAGGGLLIQDALLPVCNNTIVNNHSLRGNGIYVSGESSKFYNNIFWGESDDEQIYISQITTIPEFYNCNIKDGENGFAGADNYIYENNIDVQPSFNTQSPDHPYSLSENSYCINYGFPDTIGLNLPNYDFSGNDRVFENHIDIGAYEYQQISQIVISPEFSLPSGSYSGNCSLELSCETVDATIYYTTDDSEPDENSNVYMLPIQISETTTVKAKAFKAGFLPSLISAENYFLGTSLSGEISGVLSLALSPYIVNDNIFLNNDESLIIEPGVKLFFDGEYEFLINGCLTAIGTETDSILFTAIDHFNGWRGITIQNSYDSSDLDHCILSYAKKCDDYFTDDGGAINITNTNYITIRNCRFHHNFSARGGAIFINGSSNITIENNLFTNNGVRSRGGAIHVEDGSYAFINYNTIINNLGNYGSGICFDNASGSVKNNWICRNYGSTIKVQSGSPTFTGNIIANNSGYGNGIAFNLEDFSNVDIVNCTIVDNYATNSSNYNEAIYCVYATNPTISNTILFNPGIRELYAEQSVVNSYPFLNYCLVEGGDAGFNHSVVIDENPLFDTSAYTFPYELSENSPCIDFGTDNIGGYNFPETDFLGNERFWDSDGNGSVIIDLGVYEFGSEPPVSIDEDIVQTTPSIQLEKNYPNPFNPETMIKFSISDDSKTTLSVYNIKGQLVRTLIDEKLERGNHDVIWFGKDNNDKSVSSGVYFYKLKVNKIEAVKKCLLLK